MAMVSLVMILFATLQTGYAQSQYRRGNSSQGNQNNSVYKAQESPDKKKQPVQQRPQAQKPQPQKPSYQQKPQQGNKPPQYGNKPPQGNRPPQYGNKPPQGNRPPQYGKRPSGRPGIGSMPAPPPNHYRPSHHRHTLPRGVKVIHRGPYDYYFADGRYYRFVNNVYVICHPPVGAVIARTLLDGVITLTNYAVRDAYGRSQRYYTDNGGVYYIKSRGNYIVVDPPVGAIVYDLPYGFEEVTINGTKYYKVDNNFYELIYNGPDNYYFRVVGTISQAV